MGAVGQAHVKRGSLESLGKKAGWPAFPFSSRNAHFLKAEYAFAFSEQGVQEEEPRLEAGVGSHLSMNSHILIFSPVTRQETVYRV